MIISFVDSIFYSLMGLSIILFGIGASCAYNWTIFLSLGNTKDMERFNNAKLWYL